MNSQSQLRPMAELSPEVAAILESYPKKQGYLLQLFRVFANSTRFLKKGVTNLLDRQSPLSLREREIVILRVCANNRCEYEWGVHVAGFAKAARLTDEQIGMTTIGEVNDNSWTEREATLLRVVDELCRTARLADMKAAFEKHWSLEQQLEILALCGNYHTISFVANTAHLPLESFAARFPE